MRREIPLIVAVVIIVIVVAIFVGVGWWLTTRQPTVEKTEIPYAPGQPYTPGQGAPQPQPLRR